MPEAALDNWQPVWNAQVSMSTPVCVNFELRPGAGHIHNCWLNLDALAHRNAYKPTKELINYRGPAGDRTYDLQTEATPPAASCPVHSLHAIEIVSNKHLPEAALDNWQPVWNAQMSISTPYKPIKLVNIWHVIYRLKTQIIGFRSESSIPRILTYCIIDTREFGSLTVSWIVKKPRNRYIHMKI